METKDKKTVEPEVEEKKKTTKKTTKKKSPAKKTKPTHPCTWGRNKNQRRDLYIICMIFDCG